MTTNETITLFLLKEKLSNVSFEGQKLANLASGEHLTVNDTLVQGVPFGLKMMVVLHTEMGALALSRNNDPSWAPPLTASGTSLSNTHKDDYPGL